MYFNARNKVIAYAFCWLKCYERSYSTHDVELAPRVLLGEFKFITHICRVSHKTYVDHQNLRYTFIRKELNLRQQSLKVMECRFNITHDKANVTIDALSIKPPHKRTGMLITQLGLLTELQDFNVQLVSHGQTHDQMPALYFHV